MSTAFVCLLHLFDRSHRHVFPLLYHPFVLPCSILIAIKASHPDALPARSHTNITSLKFVDVASPSMRPLPHPSRLLVSVSGDLASLLFD
jgi:hypothetical protein